MFNIGCGSHVNLLDYIHAIELATGKQAIKEYLPMQKGDVLSTHADPSRLKQHVGYVAKTNVDEGGGTFGGVL